MFLRNLGQYVFFFFINDMHLITYKKVRSSILCHPIAEQSHKHTLLLTPTAIKNELCRRIYFVVGVTERARGEGGGGVGGCW